MSELSIKIDEADWKLLNDLAVSRGKTINLLLNDLIKDYIKGCSLDTLTISKLSENSFKEWDNSQDEIYDRI
jgi:hypothetical protein